MADVLIALLYVQGLDLSVGDAGTVLVKGGRSTGETCPTGQGRAEGDTPPRGGEDRSGGSEMRQRSKHRGMWAVKALTGHYIGSGEWRELE